MAARKESAASDREMVIWLRPVRGAGGLLRGEGVAVDDNLIFAGVIRDADDVADSMAVLAESLDDQIDVYHA